MKKLIVLLLVMVFSMGCSDTTPPPIVSPSIGLLKWDVPTVRMDGSALSLSEIGGYRVYDSDNEYTGFNLLIDTANTNYSIAHLVAGTYYFYVTTYDTAGDESVASNIVTVNIGG